MNFDRGQSILPMNFDHGNGKVGMKNNHGSAFYTLNFDHGHATIALNFDHEDKEETLKRLVDKDLLEWKSSLSRKPLLVRGGRQIGKTHAVRVLGKSFDNFVEINFERRKDAHSFFENDLDPHQIIKSLSILTLQEIKPGKTLLFFDEIQAVPRALTSLRYFYELMPELHIIAAGSLLDFAIQSEGMPVGRIESLYMHPLSFLEFLYAMEGGHILVKAILEHPLTEQFPEPIHKKLLGLVGQYIAIGGMPEAVKSWWKNSNPLECAKVHHSILDSYRQDFSKYGKKHELKYLNTLFESIPRQLGQRFKYSLVEGDYRKRELAPCLELLSLAGIIHRIYHSSGQGIPLGAEVHEDYFKIILLDVGLCQALLDLPARPLLLFPAEELINRGSIVEAFIGQELLAYSHTIRRPHLYYWQKFSREGQAEVDYLTQDNHSVIPIEVKSGLGSTLASLNTFLESHFKSPYGIRFSSHNYPEHQKVRSYPLYALASAFQSTAEIAQKLLSE